MYRPKHDWHMFDICWYACWKRNVFSWRLKVLVSVSLCFMQWWWQIVPRSWFSARKWTFSKPQTRALRFVTSTAGGAQTRTWSDAGRCADAVVKTGWRSSCMNLIVSADITWTRFAVRRVASDGLSESGSRDHAQQDGLKWWISWWWI